MNYNGDNCSELLDTVIVLVLLGAKTQTVQEIRTLILNAFF
jgi:hypothetical protein